MIENYPKIVEIIDIKGEAKGVKTIRFRYDWKTKPGQFFMIWIPGVDEIPMSASYIGEKKGITVKEVGEATSALCKMKKRGKIGVRGPYGNGFQLDEEFDKALFIGGGTGIATLAPCIEQLKEKSSAIIGAKNEQELLFIDRIKKSCADLWISTDDGSLGYKGMASDLAEKLLAEEKFDLVITCGPEKMMKELAMFCIKNGIKFQASLERWMKCGVGICGSCCIDGMRVCTDGPVFDGELLKNFEEFGNFKRESSGKKVRI